jgi:hypothetical protein
MKKFLLYSFVFLHVLSLYAQVPDLNVTAFHQLGSSTGSLSITISQDYSPPFSLIVTGPNGYTFSATISANTYNLTGLSVGEYCVSVTNGTGCVATLCIKVQKCNTNIFHGTTITSCTVEAEEHTGDPGVLYAKGNFVGEDNFLIEILLNRSTALSDLQRENILKTVEETTSYILQHGSSPYEITSQNEVNAEGFDYVFKLQTDAKLIWVYHPYNNADRGRHVANRVSNTTVPYFVYPNPASDFFQIFHPGENENKYKLTLTDLAGRPVMPSFSLTETNSVVPVNSLPNGMYLLNSSNQNGQTTLKIIVSH